MEQLRSRILTTAELWALTIFHTPINSTSAAIIVPPRARATQPLEQEPGIEPSCPDWKSGTSPTMLLLLVTKYVTHYVKELEATRPLT